MTAPKPSGSVYELTVAGALGPVLQEALSPFATPRIQQCTVLRARMSDCDVAALVLLLTSRGLQVDLVTPLGEQARRAERAERG